ncbi:MAG: FAD:protein FMN transferase [Longimicrobiaceae bacterium]
MIRTVAAAVAAMAPAACAPLSPPSPPLPVVVTAPDSVPRPTVRAWPAMGGLLQVSVWDADTARALAAMEAARAAVLHADSLTSAEKAGSEIAAVNRRAGTDSATTLSPWTAEVLDSALSIAASSSGALDVTSTPLDSLWATWRERAAPPPQAERDAAETLVGWRQVRFDRATRRASLPRQGMRLDLGVLARGFAIDRGIDALRAAGVERAVVDLGGSFAVLGAAPVESRWSMGLGNPFQLGEVFAAVQVDSGAVATWTDVPGTIETDGQRFAHTLDPRTRFLTRGIASVSVLAPSALLADALSQAFFVMGPAEGCRLAARYPGVDVVWVRDPGEELEEDYDADEGVDPELVVITDALADRLELLSEEPTDERPTRCSELAR